MAPKDGKPLINSGSSPLGFTEGFGKPVQHKVLTITFVCASLFVCLSVCLSLSLLSVCLSVKVAEIPITTL